jgi:hypothetical protein
VLLYAPSQHPFFTSFVILYSQISEQSRMTNHVDVPSKVLRKNPSILPLSPALLAIFLDYSRELGNMESFSRAGSSSYDLLAELLESAPSYKRPRRPKSTNTRVSSCMPVTLLQTKDTLRRPNHVSIKKSSPSSQDVWSTTVTLTLSQH